MSRTFYIQLLNKNKSIYDYGLSKIYPDLNPTAPPESQAHSLKEFTEIEAHLLDEMDVRECLAKKK